MNVTLRQRATLPVLAAAVIVLAGCSGRAAAVASPGATSRPMTAVGVPFPEWEPLAGGAGRAIQRVLGDKRNAGPFIERVRFPAGFSAAAHTHTGDAHIFVLEGELHMGFGLAVDSAKAIRVGPGGYLHVPRGTLHYEWYTATTIMQVEGVGPIATAMADTTVRR